MGRITMLFINSHPDMPPEYTDPLSNPNLINIVNEQMRIFSDFALECAGKILSDESLALFVETKAEIPGFTGKLILLTPTDQRLEVFFRDKLLGEAYCHRTIIAAEGDKPAKVEFQLKKTIYA